MGGLESKRPAGRFFLGRQTKLPRLRTRAQPGSMVPHMSEQNFLANLRAEQVRLHAAAFKGALVGSALLGVVLAVMLRHTVEHKLLGVWLACLALALGARVALLWWQRRRLDEKALHPARVAQNLVQLRTTFVLHGLVWCAAAVVFLPKLGQIQADLLVLALVAISVGSIINTTFDLWACALFSLPTFLFLAGHFATAGKGAAATGIIVAGFFAVVALSAVRAWRKLKHSIVQREQDVNALRDADKSLRITAAAANSIDDMLSVAGEDEVYRMVNDAWCRRTGITREQIVGKRLLDLLPDAFDPVRRPAILECLEKQAPFVVTGPVTLPTLSGRIVQTTYYPHGEDEAGIRCVAMVTRDITDQENGRALLAQQADYLKRTLDTTGDGIFAVDASKPDEPLRFINQRMLDMFGLKREEAEALTPAKLTDKVSGLFIDAHDQVRRVEAIVATRRSHEDLLELRDGRVLLRRCTPAEEGLSKVRVWSFRDITQEQRAQQSLRASEAELRALLGAFPGHIAAIDRHLHYTFVNERAASVLGLAPGAAVGRHLREVLGDERFVQVEAELRKVLAGEKAMVDRHFPATAQRPALDLEVTHVAGVVRPDGEQTLYAFGQDITERKRVEVALIEARDEAERANRAKSQFLAHMSHELRTPLNAILGFAQLLESDERLPLAAAHRAYTREIVLGGRHLLALINDVLDLGRIESGRLAVDNKSVPLLPVVQDCLRLVEALAHERQIELVPPNAAGFDVQVLADSTRLKQVLLNLLGNAIKYNHPGGSVALDAQLEGQSLRLQVSDTGAGLTAEQQLHLFEPFERLGAEERGVEGSGIGLALSRRIMQAMGGDIGAQSTPGVGSTFWIRLLRPTQDQSSAATQLTKPLEMTRLMDTVRGATTQNAPS